MFYRIYVNVQGQGSKTGSVFWNNVVTSAEKSGTVKLSSRTYLLRQCAISLT